MPRLYKLGPRSLFPSTAVGDGSTGSRPYGRLFNGTDQFPGGFTPQYGVQLPLEFLNTDRPNISSYGDGVVVSNASALTTAFTNADLAGGGLIRLSSSFTATKWSAPARTTTGWIVIEPEDQSKILAHGTRTNPTLGATLPSFTNPENDPNASALDIGSSTSYVWFRSLRFYNTPDADFIYPGGGSLITTHRDSHHIVIEQCAFLQQKSTHLRRAIALSAHHSAVIDSWVDAGWSGANEAQSIWFGSQQGVVKIVNNFLSGMGECFMSGGSDPADDDFLTYYPKDLEFRRNHLTHYKKFMEFSQEWADYWDNARTGFTVSGSTATSVTVTGNTFDTTQYSGNVGWEGTDRAYVYVTSGVAQGSYGRVNSYASNTTANVVSWYGPAPSAGDTLVVRVGPRYIQKNLFELKNMRRAYVAENFMEGHPSGDASQYYAIILKSVNQTTVIDGVPREDIGDLSTCQDVCLYDNIVTGVNGGIQITNTPEHEALPTARIHVDNTLFLGNDLDGARSIGYAPSAHDHSVTRCSFFRFCDRNIMTGTLQMNNVHIQRNVFSVRDIANYGMYYDALNDNPDGGFPSRFVIATSTMNNNGFVNPTGSHDDTPDWNIEGSTYMIGNIGVHNEPDVKIVNPSLDYWGAADWGLADDTPFQDAEGKFGVDYQDLVTRTLGVRASTSHVPQEDWGVV